VYGPLRTGRGKGSRGRSGGEGEAEGGDRVRRGMATATSKGLSLFRSSTDLYPHLRGVKRPAQVKWPANARLGSRTGQLSAKG